MSLLMRMLEIRKERAAMASRRARQDFLKAQDFSQQVDAYAQEYDDNWSRSVVKGDQVEYLQTQAAFTNRLQATAAQQREEARLLENESQRVLGKAVQESERLRIVREWLIRQQRQKASEQDRRLERQMEDVLQSRIKSR